MWITVAPGLFVLLWASGFPITRLGLEYAEPFTILTMPSAGPIAGLHDRMPVMLDDVAMEYWLAGEDDKNPPALRELKATEYADALTSWPVARRVNHARNEGPELIEPLDTDSDESA